MSTVLVLRALGLGDTCAVVPALRGIVAAHPRSRVLLAAPAPLAPLLPLVDPRLELLPVGGLDALPPEARGASLAVNLHGRGPESTAVVAAAEPRDLIAFDRFRPGWPVAAWREDEHERDRWCRLLSTHGIRTDPDDMFLSSPPDRGLVPEGVTVLHPGAAARARRWPLRRWVRVAGSLRRAGHHVVLTGSPDERTAALVLAAAIGLDETDVLAGRTDVAELAGVVACSGLVLSGDTGVAHLAFAYRRPSVTLYGPVSPARWGPPQAAVHEVLWAGRTGDPHGRFTDRGLRRISVRRVLDACERVIRQDSADVVAI